MVRYILHLNSGKQTLIAALVASMVIIAGCGNLPTSQNEGPVIAPVVGPVNSSDSVSTPISSQTGSQSNTAFDTRFQNVTQEKLNQVNQTLYTYYSSVFSNRTSVTEYAARTANMSCRRFPALNMSMFANASLAQQPGIVQRRSRVISHAVEVVNANSDVALNADGILRNVADKAGWIAKYTTFIGAWNEYHEAACNFVKSVPETVEDYYIASGALVFELSLMQYQMYYKTAFKTVQVASHTRIFRAIQSSLGDEALGLTMSISHWVARGTFETAPRYISRQADELKLSVDTSSLNLASVRSMFPENSIAAVHNTSEAVRNMTVNCYEEITESKDNGGILDQGEEWINDQISGIQDWVYDVNVSKTLADVKGVDPADLPENTIHSVQQCVAEKRNSSG